MILRAWKFFQRDLLTEWNSRFSILFQLLNIVLSITSYLFLSSLVDEEVLSRWTPYGREGYFQFVLVGMAVNGAMLTALMGLTRSLQMQQPSGFLKPLLFSQTRPEGVLLYSSIYPQVRALLDLNLYLLAGLVLGGLTLSRANLPAVLLIAILSVAAFGSLGLWASAFTVLFKLGNPVLWVISSASWLLGGVVFPQAFLREPLLILSKLLPMTHAVRGMRAALLNGASLGELTDPVAFLLGFTVIMAPLGLVVFRMGLRRAQTLGTLAEW